MKILSGLLIMMFLSMLINSNVYAQQNSTSTHPKLKILYFHATMRCPTCNAIEDNARKLLDKSFRSRLDNGEIKFESYNVDETANKALVDKYQISFSTLLLIKGDGTKIDFTSKAFQYALVNPAKYEALLKEEIKKNLE